MCSGTDLRDFYYSFRVGRQRLLRNSLVGPLTIQQARRFQSFDPKLSSETEVFPALNSLAMTSHLAILVQSGLVREDNLLSMNLAPPRGPSCLGVVIDDLVSLEALAQPRSQRCLQAGLHVACFPIPRKRSTKRALPRYGGAGSMGLWGWCKLIPSAFYDWLESFAGRPDEDCKHRTPGGTCGRHYSFPPFQTKIALPPQRSLSAPSRRLRPSKHPAAFT